MPETDLIAPSNVMRTNAMTRRAFRARHIGSFERVGPNSWDSYRLIGGSGAIVNVAAGIEVQLEARGARFRIRERGSVRLFEWVPEGAAPSDAGEARATFKAEFVTDHRHRSGLGVRAAIAKRLIT